MSKKIKIECTEQQYEVLRAMIRNLISQIEIEDYFTKQKHCSRKNKYFSTTVPFKKVRLLQHMKEQFK